MTTDLSAKLTITRSDLRKLWAAWDACWVVNLDYGPSGQGFEPRVSGTTYRDELDPDDPEDDGGGPQRPLPVRLDRRTGNVRQSDLSSDYVASVRQLAAAMVAVDLFSWNGPQSRTEGVLPVRQSHYPLSLARSVARDVNYGLIAAEWRHTRNGLDVADIVHAQVACEQVTAALLCLPDDMTGKAHGKRVCSGAPLRPPCTNLIPDTHTRCSTCRNHVAMAKDATADQRSA